MKWRMVNFLSIFWKTDARQLHHYDHWHCRCHRALDCYQHTGAVRQAEDNHD